MSNNIPNYNTHHSSTPTPFYQGAENYPEKNSHKTLIIVLSSITALLVLFAAFFFSQNNTKDVTPAVAASETTSPDAADSTYQSPPFIEETRMVETLTEDKTFTIRGLPSTWEQGEAGAYWSEDMTAGVLFQYYPESMLKNIKEAGVTQFLEGFNSTYGDASKLGDIVKQEDLRTHDDGSFSTVVYYSDGETAGESATYLLIEDGALLISTVINNDTNNADEYHQAIDASRTIQLVD